MKELALQQISDYFQLENLTPEIELSSVFISNREINRPAVNLTGFYDFFDHERIQLFGKVEHAYMTRFSPEEKRKVYREFFAYDIPCMVICRGLECGPEIFEEALATQTPILRTELPTTEFMGRLIQYLRTLLAPEISMHGVLVDIFGVGVLITGESGIGKSETALELVRRGHRLVADDLVVIRKFAEHELLGSSPEVLKHFVELRGIGIVNVKELYGVEAVKETQKIDMVIRLEPWDREKEYDRVGTENETMDILDCPVVLYTIPIHSGRNLAIIIEAATINHRSRELGYNAAEELSLQVSENIRRRMEARREMQRRSES